MLNHASKGVLPDERKVVVRDIVRTTLARPAVVVRTGEPSLGPDRAPKEFG